MSFRPCEICLKSRDNSLVLHNMNETTKNSDEIKQNVRIDKKSSSSYVIRLLYLCILAKNTNHERLYRIDWH